MLTSSFGWFAQAPTSTFFGQLRYPRRDGAFVPVSAEPRTGQCWTGRKLTLVVPDRERGVRILRAPVVGAGVTLDMAPRALGVPEFRPRSATARRPRYEPQSPAPWQHAPPES